MNNIAALAAMEELYALERSEAARRAEYEARRTEAIRRAEAGFGITLGTQGEEYRCGWCYSHLTLISAEF